MQDRHDKDKSVEGLVAKRLLESRTILLSGSINDEQAHKIVGQLLLLDAEDGEKPIRLIINSGGGSISSGFHIFDTIQALQAPVITIGSGLVASMGVTLFLSVPKERRFAFAHARYMIHQPLIPGTVVAVASDVEINAREMVKTRDLLNRLIADATSQPLAKVEKDTLRDYWLSADEAVEYGIVGKAITKLTDLPGVK